MRWGRLPVAPAGGPRSVPTAEGRLSRDRGTTEGAYGGRASRPRVRRLRRLARPPGQTVGTRQAAALGMSCPRPEASARGPVGGIQGPRARPCCGPGRTDVPGAECVGPGRDRVRGVPADPRGLGRPCDAVGQYPVPVRRPAQPAGRDLKAGVRYKTPSQGPPPFLVPISIRGAPCRRSVGTTVWRSPMSTRAVAATRSAQKRSLCELQAMDSGGGRAVCPRRACWTRFSAASARCLGAPGAGPAPSGSGMLLRPRRPPDTARCRSMASHSLRALDELTARPDGRPRPGAPRAHPCFPFAGVATMEAAMEPACGRLGRPKPQHVRC